MRYTERRLLLSAAAVLLLVWAILHVLSISCSPEDAPFWRVRQPSAIVNGENVHTYNHNGKLYTNGHDMPLIFIGGVPRSGTTLMRAMLDAHPDIRCGQETHVIPFIVDMRSRWLRSQKESVRLQEAGVTEEVLNSAIAAFSLEIILGHGDPAPRLCNKDPLLLTSAAYLAQLFPQAKFIFMIRDGRATVHSIISRQVAIRGFSLSNYRQCLMDWNRTIGSMYNQCLEVGSSRCLMVPYEQLVLHPRAWMEKILSYIDVPWNDYVLHHEDLVDKPGGVMLSSVEQSTDQVIKPVNLDALTKWVGHIPPNVVANMSHIAPMLSVLGYNPHANPPHYGYPDAAVVENTKLIHSQVQGDNETKDVSNPKEVHPYG